MGVLFQRQDLFDAASALKVYGVETSKLTDYTKILSKGVAIGKTSFQELSEILGQVVTDGRLSGDAFDVLARRAIKLPDSMRGAKVSAEELFAALDKALPDSILEGRANTIDGAMIRLQSSFRDLGGAILGVDKDTSTFIKGGLGDRFVQLLNDLRVTLRSPEFTEAFAKFGKAIGDFAESAIPKLLNAFTFLARNFDKVILALKLLVGAWLFTKATMAVLSFVSAASTAFGFLGKVLGTTTKAMDPLNKTASKVGTGLGDVIASIFKPLGKPDVIKGVASAALIGVAIYSIATGISKASSAEINLSKLGQLAVATGVATLIFSLIGKLGGQATGGAIIGALIGVALAAIGWGISTASDKAKTIDIGALTKLIGSLAVITAIFTALSFIAPLGAIGATGAAIISGALVLSAMALAKVSELSSRINIDQIMNLQVAIAKITAITSALGLLAPLSALGTIVQQVIVSGVLVAAEKLRLASIIAAQIAPSNLERLYEALKWIANIDTGGILKNLKNLVNSSILTIVASQVRNTSETLNSVQPIDMFTLESLMASMKKLSEIETGSTFGGLKNLLKSKLLSNIADHVKSVADTFNSVQIVDTSSIGKLNQMMLELSKIKMEGGGFFDDRGDKARELAGVAEQIRKTIDSLQGIRTDGLKEKLEAFQRAINGNWDQGKAQAFTNYMKALAGEDSFRRIKNFTDTIGTVVVEGFSAKLEAFQLALSFGWNKDRAQAFSDYMKILSGDATFEKVRNFVTLLNEVDTVVFSDKLLKFQTALATAQWPKATAEAFVEYMKILNGAGDFSKVTAFIQLANTWGTAELADKLDAFEFAINRKGYSWDPDKAGRFINFMKKLSGDFKFDPILTLISQIGGMQTAGLADKMDQAELAINRKGYGWDQGVAQRFVDFWNTFGGLSYDMKNARAMIESFAGINTEGVANASQAVMTIIGTIVQNITANMTKFFEAGKSLSSEFTRGIDTARDGAMRAGANLQGGVWDAINARVKDLYPLGVRLGQELANGVGSMRNAAYESGVYAVSGFISGAQSKNTYTVGGWIVQNFLKGMRNAAGERSPWKTTTKSGEYAVDGLTKGIERRQGYAVRAAQSLAQSVSGAIADTSLMPQVTAPAFASIHSSAPQDVYSSTAGANTGAVINQTNNVYTEVDMGKINRDLAWELSKS